MHLATHYAPGSFLKPVLIVDTVFNEKTRETAIKFAEALNVDHAFTVVRLAKSSPYMEQSEWIIVKEHATRDEAVAFHLDYTKHFHNGGSEEEWREGWEPYLALWEQHCPASMRS